jgi:tetratricopeptide (TPR) repeat protein
LNGQGLAYGALERWEEALGCFERAIHYHEGDSWFWHNYGDALLMLARHDAARSAFEQALLINPGHERSSEKLAGLKDLLKDED